jgi:hypothetical protein
MSVYISSGLSAQLAYWGERGERGERGAQCDHLCSVSDLGELGERDLIGWKKVGYT